MPYLKCRMCHELCLPVWAELVYIKQFQIFGYVNKRLTRFVWSDTSKLLMFRDKVPEEITWLESALIIRNSLNWDFHLGNKW